MNNHPVSYKQYDARWAFKPYNGPGESDKTIKSSGCGPTCAAMCIAALANPKVTPVDTCRWSREHGYKYANQGTAYGYFKPQLAEYGVECRQLLPSRITNQPDHPVHDQVKEYLRQGYWVIALMGPKSKTQRGTWTSGGHYVLVWDWDDKVRILDPISAAAKRANGDPDTFRNEARQYWVVDARAYNGKETDDMTGQEIYEKLNEYMETQPVPNWAKEELRQAVEAGVTDGSHPMALIPRYQAALMAYRAMGK